MKRVATETVIWLGQRGCTKAYCMTPIMYCVDPNVINVELRSPNFRRNMTGNTGCGAPPRPTLSGNVDGVADDAIVVGPTKFKPLKIHSGVFVNTNK